MRNQLVVDKFLNRKKGRSSNGNVSTDGTKLYSYKTVIAQYTSSFGLIINETKYSQSTSYVQSLLSQGEYFVSDVPRGSDSIEEIAREQIDRKKREIEKEKKRELDLKKFKTVVNF